MAELDAVEYAVYGVLCAAKRETGPGGARRLYRIEEALDFKFTEDEIQNAMRKLMAKGWARQLEPVLGMRHYEATALVLVPDA